MIKPNLSFIILRDTNTMIYYYKDGTHTIHNNCSPYSMHDYHLDVLKSTDIKIDIDGTEYFINSKQTTDYSISKNKITFKLSNKYKFDIPKSSISQKGINLILKSG